MGLRLKSVFTKEYEDVISALIAARKRADLTQQQLAARLRKPQSFVSKYERRERRIDVVEFVTVSLALGIDPSMIVKSLSGQVVSRSRRKPSP